MLEFFKAINEINNSIFQHDKVKSGNGDPLRKSPISPLKYPPKRNSENDDFDFFSTIFNLCSGGERRDCKRKKSNKKEKKEIKENTKENIDTFCLIRYRKDNISYISNVLLNENDYYVIKKNNSDYEIGPPKNQIYTINYFENNDFKKGKIITKIVMIKNDDKKTIIENNKTIIEEKPYIDIEESPCHNPSSNSCINPKLTNKSFNGIGL